MGYENHPIDGYYAGSVARKTDSGAFPLPMQTVDGTPSRDAAMHRCPQKQYLLLPRRGVTTKVDKLRSCTGNDTVRNSHGATWRNLKSETILGEQSPS